MNYVAIGAVTKSMAELLERKMNKPPLLGTGTFKVTTLPPDDNRVTASDGVNLFLYRVTEDPFTRNAEWRGDRANPVGSTRSPLALTLHYLVTAFAKRSTATARDDITAHRLLGNAMAILHEHPVLNAVHDGDFDADVDDHFASDLRNSFESIKITPSPISIDDLTKLWTGLTKAFRLSVAYDVSLVQIAPSRTRRPGPPVQRVALDVVTIHPPIVTDVVPETGPAGATVTLRGNGLTARGAVVFVDIGDVRFTAADLVQIAENEIVLRIPEAPLRGPVLPIVVSVGGASSEPKEYRVTPWIDRISPLRGSTGVPLTLSVETTAGAVIQVEVDGQLLPAAAVQIDTARQEVRATIPAIATNGPKAVVILANSRRSNARFYEVLPVISTVTVTVTPNPASTTIAVMGQRLAGNDTYLRYGTLVLRKGQNTSAAGLSVDVSRALPASAPVAAIVDGRESNVLPPALDRIDPPSASEGSTILLHGRGLGGATVVVTFGAVAVQVGPNPMAAGVRTQVPAGIAGSVQVKATVDGQDTNSLPFRVLP